jgi:hypothetical protein
MQNGCQRLARLMGHQAPGVRARPLLVTFERQRAPEDRGSERRNNNAATRCEEPQAQTSIRKDQEERAVARPIAESREAHRCRNDEQDASEEGRDEIGAQKELVS